MGGNGVVVRECAGVNDDRSIVRDSHSLVMACRSSLVNGGWDGGGPQAVEDEGRW